MKAIFTLLTFLLTTFLTAFAQQPPNAGFETWTQPINPDSWSSIENALGLNTNLFTFKDTTTFTEGIASCKLVSDTLAGHHQYGVVVPVISLGVNRFDNVNGVTYSGIPFTNRPDSLIFDYKFTTPGPDTPAVTMILSHNFINKMLNLTQNLSSSANWTHVAIALAPYYLNPSTPDTLKIQFTSSNSNQPIRLSTLHVDGVRLGYLPPPKPTATILASGPLTFCQGSFVTLHADSASGYSFQWQIDGNVIPGANSSVYVASTSGAYTMQVDSANFIDTSAPVIITVLQPAISLTGLNDTVCSSASSIILTGGAPVGGTYAGSGIIASTFSPGSASLGLDTISYTAIDSNSCAGTASATIFVEVCEGITSIDAASVSVFPNPASSILKVKSNTDLKGFELRIFDLVGKLVFNQVLTNADNTINVAKLANGSYIYRITAKENFVVSQSNLSIIK